MNVNVNAQNLGAWLVRLLGIAGVAISAINPASLPTSYRGVLLVVSAIVIAVDRYLTDPSTGNPVTPPPAPSPSPQPMAQVEHPVIPYPAPPAPPVATATVASGVLTPVPAPAVVPPNPLAAP